MVALYNLDTTTYNIMQTAVKSNSETGQYFWKRYIAQYSNSNIMTQSSPRSNFTDVLNSETSVTGLNIRNDDHFVTAMAAVGTFPEIVKSLMKL